MVEGYQKVATHALIKKDGKYLVLHRSPVNDYKPNEWDTPGGSVEFGEDHTKALIREVLEETGLKVKVLKPLFVHSFMSSPERHQFQIIFECEYVAGEVRLNPEEHDRFLWATYDEIGKLERIGFLDSLYKNVLTK
jgi:8-oxo-dGTP diphosphatase